MKSSRSAFPCSRDFRTAFPHLALFSSLMCAIARASSRQAEIQNACPPTPSDSEVLEQLSHKGWRVEVSHGPYDSTRFPIRLTAEGGARKERVSLIDARPADIRVACVSNERSSLWARLGPPPKCDFCLELQGRKLRA